VVISISGKAEKPHIAPDPAHVTLGEAVTWHVRLYPTHDLDLECKIYFDADNPFNSSYGGTLTLRLNAGTVALLRGGPAQEPGDYKYGVRISTTMGVTLSDDDPRLIVR
jgi:hypothetical protein